MNYYTIPRQKASPISLICQSVEYVSPADARNIFFVAWSAINYACPDAGSRKRGDTEAEDIELAAELLANTKERKEHNLVVEHLNRQLHRRTENNLDVPGTPTVRKLGTVQHLETTISGELRHADAWDLLEALHPTPAVLWPAASRFGNSLIAPKALIVVCTPVPLAGY